MHRPISLYRISALIMLSSVLLGSVPTSIASIPLFPAATSTWQTTAWEERPALPTAAFLDGLAALDIYTYAFDGVSAYYTAPGWNNWFSTNSSGIDGVPGDYVSNGQYIWQFSQCANIYYTSAQGGPLAAWQPTTGQVCGWGGRTYRFGLAAANGYILQIGGYGAFGFVFDAVGFIPINGDGTLGSWNFTADLPAPRADMRVAAWEDWVYVLGGYDATPDGSGIYIPNDYSDTVYYGQVQSNGQVNNWITGPAMPVALEGFSAVVYDDALYIIGGIDAGGEYSRRVYRAEIDNGVIGFWEEVDHLRLPNGRYGQAVAQGDWTVTLAGGNRLGTTTATVERAVLSYTLDELSERIESEPTTLVGRPLTIRAVPIATWDFTFGTADALTVLDFLHQVHEALTVLFTSHPATILVFGKAYAVGHLVNTFVDGRAHVYMGVDLPWAGGALVGLDFPAGSDFPTTGQPYLLHGTIASTSFFDLEGWHILYYFDLDDQDGMLWDLPNSSNPRFPIIAGAAWRSLPTLVGEHLDNTAYGTLGIVDRRYRDGDDDVIYLRAPGQGDEIPVRIPHGSVLPDPRNLVVLSGVWHEGSGLHVDADDVHCITDRANFCLESVVPEGQELSLLQQLVIWLGSPADVHLYDDAGNHTGLLYDGGGNPVGAESNVPNTVYFAGDDESHEAILVTELEGSSAYTITVRGRDVGTYTLAYSVAAPDHTVPFTRVLSSQPTTPGQIDVDQGLALPAMPTDVNVSQEGTARLHVTWNADPDPAVQGYNVYLRRDGGGPYRANTTPVAGSAFDVTAFRGGTDYEVGVTAVSTATLESGFSTWFALHTTAYTVLPLMMDNYAPGVLPPNDPPHMPAGPSPADGALDQPTTLTLSWSGGDPDGDVVTYDVYFEADDPTPDVLRCDDSTVASCDPGPLAAGTHYYWRVVARDEHGATTSGPAWDLATAALPNDPPDIPSTPIPADGALNQPLTVTLNWSGGDPDGDTVTYDVYFEADDPTPDVLLCDGNAATACDPGPLAAGTHYTWQVIATDEHGATTDGPVWDLTTTAAPNTPNTPAPADGALNQPLTVTLGWSGGDPDGDAVTYDVYFEADDPTPDALLCDDTTVAACDPGPLSAGTHYYWHVRARETHGLTATGPVWSFTTLSPCHIHLNDATFEYGSLQDAVDASSSVTDVVRISGYCPGVSARAGLTQSAYLSKTLTLQGGWNDTFTVRDPLLYPSTLDGEGRGRVLYVTGVSATVEGLYITGGDAAGLGGHYIAGYDYDAGGGIYATAAALTLRDSAIEDGAAVYGGGVYATDGTMVLSGNTVENNTATDGGGIYLYSSSLLLGANTLQDNVASRNGGGVYLINFHHTAILTGNTLSGNLAGNTSHGNGGGLTIYGGEAQLDSNLFFGNTSNSGGGIYFSQVAFEMDNNIVARNRGYEWGSGLYVTRSTGQLRHNTLASNSWQDVPAIYLTDYVGEHSSLTLTNTIVSHHLNGLLVTAGNTATLEATLWYNSGYDWAGAGTIVTGTVNVWGDPALVDIYGGDLHIDSGSAARDAGVDAGVTVDIDGDTRPTGPGYDIGADEYVPLNRAPLNLLRRGRPSPAP